MFCSFSRLLVLVVFRVALDCPRIYTDAHGLGLCYSTQNRRVVDPIAFAWKGFCKICFFLDIVLFSVMIFVNGSVVLDMVIKCVYGFVLG
jgi:hypothetical protein